jgi:hypothetical protein
MQTIRNALRRVLIAPNLVAIMEALLRLRRNQMPPATGTTEPAPNPPPPEEYTEEDDSEERFAGWETARAETLHEAGTCERQGLRLLARAALLRLAVQCDDAGETFIADQLREHAIEPPVPDSVWDRPPLRIVGTDNTPTQRGA